MLSGARRGLFRARRGHLTLVGVQSVIIRVGRHKQPGLYIVYVGRQKQGILVYVVINCHKP